jgi:hypothetical protein
MSEQKGGRLHLKQPSSSSPPNIKPEAKSFAGLAGTEDRASQAGDRFMDVLPYDDDGRLLTGGEVASIRDVYLNSRLPQFANRRSERFVAEWQGHHLPNLIATTTTNSTGGQNA